MNRIRRWFLKYFVYGPDLYNFAVMSAQQAEAHVRAAETRADYLLDGIPEAVALVREARGLPPLCHCGQMVTYGFDGDPTHHRGMCEDCDSVRCDAHPGACR